MAPTTKQLESKDPYEAAFHRLQELIQDLAGALDINHRNIDAGADPILDLYREAKHNMSWCCSRSRKKSTSLLDVLAVLEELYDARDRLLDEDPRAEILTRWIDKLEPDPNRTRWALELKRILKASETERNYLENNDRGIPRGLSTLVTSLRRLNTTRTRSFTRHLPIPDETLSRFRAIVPPLEVERLREQEHYAMAWRTLEEICE